MKNMKDTLINKISKKAANSIAEVSVKIAEESVERCLFFLCYEPSIPAEMIKENIEKYSDK